MSSAPEGRFHSVDVSSLTPGHRSAILRTSDGVTIEARHDPCTRGAAGGVPGGTDAGPGRTAIVVAHGFTGAVDKPSVRRAARVFAAHAGVVTFSFRGHGRSGGRSTVGDREVLDLAAAVAWARSLGYRRVVTVGFSMGGSVVLRHAALYGGGDDARTAASAAGSPAPPGSADGSAGKSAGETGAAGDGGGSGDAESQGGTGRTEGVGSREGRIGAQDVHTDAVAAVSAPARWYYRGTPSMRRLHWVVTRRAGRLVGRYGLGTRIHHRAWDPVPLSPVQAVPFIAPTPLLIVHGDRDPYFPLDHPRMLAGAGPCELWLEPGMGHAENAADDELLDRLADWLVRA
ncbi:alpha/beta hydrolase [Streptomyces sp. NPDC059175]|uniref:alpha/beta hydrolase n=1 Tax=Streptomyces sp. NPDC059175 TaxID=3346757 RepID=UPI0036A4C3C2